MSSNESVIFDFRHLIFINIYSGISVTEHRVLRKLLRASERWPSAMKNPQILHTSTKKETSLLCELGTIILILKIVPTGARC